MDRQTSVFDPVIVRDGIFIFHRALRVDGELDVHVGDRLEPSAQLASASVATGRQVTVQVARELDIAPDTVERHLSKPIGSTIEEGETLASARRGLRTANCVAPITATVTSIDAQTGAVNLTPITQPVAIQSIVSGEVESVIDRRGAVVRAAGSRVRGTMGFGPDAFGALKVAVDRSDRELTADAVLDSYRDAIVLGGMTVGAAALRRLSEVGARGVIVGSISDSEVRQVVSGAMKNLSSSLLWTRGPREFEIGGTAERPPLAIFVTEGFGRRRMAGPVFDFIAEYEDEVASILIPESPDVMNASPELLFTRLGAPGDDSIRRVSPAPGIVARLIDPQNLGLVVTCQSGILSDHRGSGASRRVVDVEFSNGTRRYVPATNLEIIA